MLSAVFNKIKSMGLIEVWEIWMDGKVPENTVLWGKQIYIWGRIGGFAQFFSGLYIIFEIIGHDKIKGFGAYLDGRPAMKILFQIVQNIVDTSVRFFNKIFAILHISKPKQKIHSANKSAILVKEVNITTVILALLVTYLALAPIIVELLQIGFENRFIAIIAFVLATLFLSISCLLLVLFLLTIFGEVLNKIFFRPIAWALQNPKLSKVLQVISFTTFLLGTHFSILAS